MWLSDVSGVSVEGSSSEMCKSIVSPVCSILCRALSTINCLFCTLHFLWSWGLSCKLLFPSRMELSQEGAVEPPLGWHCACSGSLQRKLCAPGNPRFGVSETIGLCLKPEEHAWLCAEPQLPAHQLCHQGGSLCSVLQLTERSQGNSLLGASAETSLPSSRGCCRGIIIHIRDKTDPKPNLKWKQMQFQLT